MVYEVDGYGVGCLGWFWSSRRLLNKLLFMNVIFLFFEVVFVRFCRLIDEFFGFGEVIENYDFLI